MLIRLLSVSHKCHKLSWSSREVLQTPDNMSLNVYKYQPLISYLFISARVIAIEDDYRHTGDVTYRKSHTSAVSSERFKSELERTKLQSKCGSLFSIAKTEYKAHYIWDVFTHDAQQVVSSSPLATTMKLTDLCSENQGSFCGIPRVMYSTRKVAQRNSARRVFWNILQG